MASIKIGNVTYGAEELSKTFQTYRKEFVIMPFLAMEQLAKHMNVRTGIRYRETVSQMSTDAEISNYSKTKHQDADVKIDPRVFETFFGNIVQGIDPNAIYQSIWGSNVTKGDGLKNVPIVVQVCGYLVKKIGEKMFMNSFTAKHDSTDTTSTSKWFNGFQTILENDVAGTNYTNKVLISADIGNLVEGAESITADNAEDLIKDFYWNQVGNPAAAAKLRSQQLKLFMSDQAYHFYTESYQTNHGSLPYNQAYDKKSLDGASNVEFVPLPCVPDDFLLLTPKNNAYLLFNQKTDDDKFLVEKSLSNHYDVDFIMNYFFGTQFESVSPEVLRYWKKKA
ncbi:MULTISPECIES: hypothetical protein [Prevotella]|jgi:hypothetical protein|uniref:hypothetical protein n=1 Tax=Prevotella merdae TaxID=2079531 RepID=UPI000D0F2024|nr:hypothetical protein [Prevotella merdae]